MVNLIGNGSFVGHAGGWFRASATDFTVAYAAGESVSEGSGALAVVRTGGAATARTLAYRPTGPRLIPLGGLTGIVPGDLRVKGEAGATATLRMTFYDGPDPDTAAMSGGLDTVGVSTAGVGWSDPAGGVITIPEWATHVQVELACGMPTVGMPLYVDDIFTGVEADHTPPYPAVALPAFPPNRIPNGTFEAGIGWWAVSDGSEVLTHETTAPIVGGGSLRVVCPEDWSGQGAMTQDFGVAADETVYLGFKIRAEPGSEGVYEVGLFRLGASPQTATVWSGEVGSGATAVSVEIAPIATDAVARLFVTNGFSAPAEFVLDDVALGVEVDPEPQSDAPPASCGPGFSLGLRVGL
jgi:hypothetical protein